MSRLAEMRDYCTKVRPIRHRRRPRPKPARQIRRTYTLAQHLVVVYLRHRSLTDLSRVWHRWYEIVKRTGVRYTTVREMVLRYYQKGTAPLVRGYAHPLRPLPRDVIDFLRDNLYEHRFLSLRKRCELVWRHCDFHMSPRRLTKNYKQMGITYEPCKTVMKAAVRNWPQRQAER